MTPGFLKFSVDGMSPKSWQCGIPHENSINPWEVSEVTIWGSQFLGAFPVFLIKTLEWNDDFFPDFEGRDSPFQNYDKMDQVDQVPRSNGDLFLVYTKQGPNLYKHEYIYIYINTKCLALSDIFVAIPWRRKSCCCSSFMFVRHLCNT